MSTFTPVFLEVMMALIVICIPLIFFFKITTFLLKLSEGREVGSYFHMDAKCIEVLEETGARLNIPENSQVIDRAITLLYIMSGPDYLDNEGCIEVNDSKGEFVQFDLLNNTEEED